MTKSPYPSKSPLIAIGALGGSGTRAVAQILIDAGIYMGDDLNSPNDNLVYCRLFKNPGWIQRHDQEAFLERLAAFEAYMLGHQLTRRQAGILTFAAVSNKLQRTLPDYYFRIARRRYATKPERLPWGWKDPNTYIFLEIIDAYFHHRMRYIHILRHGLDMAFSGNKQQLINWGYRYGIEVKSTDTPEQIAVKQLDYWIHSTEEAIRKGQAMGDRFMLLNHSHFGEDPRSHVDRILELTELEVDGATREKLYGIPKKTGTVNRYKERDISIFREDQLEKVKAFGFEVVR